MQFSAGSKTFLCGEYSVVFGGSCIVLVTEPRFKLIAEKGPTRLIGISEYSPGFKFYDSHKNIFEGFSVKFIDPYDHRGGFGASSAQYSLLYKLFLKLVGGNFDINLFLNEYQNTAESKKILPSGADCVAQFFDHNIYYDSAKKFAKKIEWKFPNLDFFILKTNVKISTYQHLKNLKNFDCSNLHFFANKIKESFENLDEKIFTKNLQNFFCELERNNLVIPQTSKSVREILALDHVKAAKGCGSLAADTILIVCDRGFKKQTKNSAMEIIKNSK